MMNIAFEQANELAKQYLEQHPLDHPDYAWVLTEGRACKTGWYFDFQFKCRKAIPEDQWEAFGGAPGFVVSSTDGKIRAVSAADYADDNF
jgi:hypothetical protein